MVIQGVKTVVRISILVRVTDFNGKSDHKITEAQDLITFNWLDTTSQGYISLVDYLKNDNWILFKVNVVGGGVLLDLVELGVMLGIYYYFSRPEYTGVNVGENAGVSWHSKCRQYVGHFHTLLSFSGITMVEVDVAFSFFHCLRLWNLSKIIDDVFDTQSSWCYSCEVVSRRDETVSITMSAVSSPSLCYVLTWVVTSPSLDCASVSDFFADTITDDGAQCLRVGRCDSKAVGLLNTLCAEMRAEVETTNANTSLPYNEASFCLPNPVSTNWGIRIHS